MAAYPRKQTALIFVVCLIVVAGLYWYVRKDANRPASQKSIVVASSVSSDVQSSSPIASNSDWKKDFLDAQQSSLTFKQPGSTAKAATPENLTASDVLGRAFMTKYAELKETGLNKDSKSVQVAMSQVISQTLSSMPAPQTFSKKNVKVVADSSPSAASYAKSLMSVFSRYMPKENGAEIASRAFDDNDMSELADIDSITAGYASMLSELSRMTVPVSAVGYHVDLMNSVAMSLYNAQSFRHIDTDPVRGLAAAQMELPALEGMAAAMSGMQRYFTQMGIRIGS
jgi:hypothetical protein